MADTDQRLSRLSRLRFREWCAIDAHVLFMLKVLGAAPDLAWGWVITAMCISGAVHLFLLYTEGETEVSESGG
jgi:hypothetical protein